MRALLALVLVVALSIPASADHCASWTTSMPEVTAAPYYVDIDIAQTDRGFSIWLYEESNGIPGLQRGDEVVDDTCHNSIRADTIIF